MNKVSKKCTERYFEYADIPFGLKNSPATFQRMTNIALRRLIAKICSVYLDRLVIFSSKIEKHNINTITLLESLRNTGLKSQTDE